MALLLVRHAHAGNPERWTGDDRLRPLSKAGRATARALVGVLAPYNPERIVSSPFVRCVQTVEPLASDLAIEVEIDARLGEGQGDLDEALLASLAGIGDHRSAAAVTHGDLIAGFMMRLQARGVTLTPHKPRWEKGSAWVLRTDGQGRITDASYIAPPAP